MPPPDSKLSTTPRRAATRIALHAGAVAHQREVAALRAHLALVAFGFRLGPAFGLGLRGAGRAPLAPLQPFGRREVVVCFLLQRNRALDGVGDAPALTVEGGDLGA